MAFFKKKISNSSDFFEEDSLDVKFADMMGWIKLLSRKDFNRLKKAMDQDYAAYQTLHGIEPDETPVSDGPEFMLSDEEVK